MSNLNFPRSRLGLIILMAWLRTRLFIGRMLKKPLDGLTLLKQVARLCQTDWRIGLVVARFCLKSKASKQKALQQLRVKAAFTTNPKVQEAQWSLIELLDLL